MVFTANETPGKKKVRHRKTNDEIKVHLKMCETADDTSSSTLSAKRIWVKLGYKAEIHKRANRVCGFLATRYSKTKINLVWFGKLTKLSRDGGHKSTLTSAVTQP